MDIDRIYSSHCHIDTVKAGGYDKRSIKNSANYLKKMLTDADDADFDKKPAHACIDDALTAGELTWWEPYSETHARNIDAIKK